METMRIIPAKQPLYYVSNDVSIVDPVKRYVQASQKEDSDQSKSLSYGQFQLPNLVDGKTENNNIKYEVRGSNPPVVGL